MMTKEEAFAFAKWISIEMYRIDTFSSSSTLLWHKADDYSKYIYKDEYTTEELYYIFKQSNK